MAFFTKLFEKNYRPYEIPGRWYRVKIDNGVIVDHDFPATFHFTINSNYLQIKDDTEKYKILKSLIVYRNLYDTGLSTGTAVLGERNVEFTFNNHQWRCTIAPSSATTPSIKSTIYLFVSSF